MRYRTSQINTQIKRKGIDHTKYMHKNVNKLDKTNNYITVGQDRPLNTLYRFTWHSYTLLLVIIHQKLHIIFMKDRILEDARNII